MAEDGRKRKKATTSAGKKASPGRASEKKRLDKIEAAVRHLLGGDAPKFLDGGSTGDGGGIQQS